MTPEAAAEAADDPMKATHNERTVMTRPTKIRYVEVSYDIDGETMFTASLHETATPNEAEAAAIADAKVRHPRAENIEEFMQRVLTPEKAKMVRRAIAAGTWQGWDFEREAR